MPVGESAADLLHRRNIEKLIKLIYKAPDRERRRRLVALLSAEEERAAEAQLNPWGRTRMKSVG